MGLVRRGRLLARNVRSPSTPAHVPPAFDVGSVGLLGGAVTHNVHAGSSRTWRSPGQQVKQLTAANRTISILNQGSRRGGRTHAQEGNETETHTFHDFFL
jgi:hypothetical protein